MVPLSINMYDYMIHTRLNGEEFVLFFYLEKVSIIGRVILHVLLLHS